MKIALALSLILCFAAAPALADKRIAISFDDIPRHQGAFLTREERAKRLIAALKQARVKQAAFFLNPGKISGTAGVSDEAMIAAYARAGHVLANHTANHLALTAVTADAYLADIDTAETWLKGRKGRRPWFRFPYLNEGRSDKEKRDAVRAGLAMRGLRNGYVTVDAADWHIDALTIEAHRAGKPIDMAALRDFYVARHVEAANFNETLAIRTLGQTGGRTGSQTGSPAHMLLLHETDIAALFIPDLIAALRKGGWTIITADTAYRDPISKLMPDVLSTQGTLTEMLAWEKGLPAPRWYRYLDMDLLTALFNEQVLKETQVK
jgi:peptidoglycan-N-acetylglucosamine deacetylase